MKKRILSMLLAATMVLSMFGCGASEETTTVKEESSTVEEATEATEVAQQEPVTLKFHTSAPEQKDQQAVFDELNKYFQEKYNTTVEWTFMGGEYEDKIGVIIGSGEEYDACFTSNWKNDYLTNVEREAFVDISGMLADYPALYASMPEAFWDAATIKGGIYAVPNQQITARQIATTIPTEYLEGTGYTAADIESAESLLDLKGYLEAAKENYGALFGGIEWDQLAYYLGYEMLGSVDLGIGVKYGDSKVVNVYDTEEFKQVCKELAELQKMGLYDDQQAVDLDYALSQRTAKRSSITYGGTMKPGGDVETSQRYGYPCTQTGSGTAYLTTGGILATMWGVSSTSQHPDRVLQILELLATDPYVMNLISYGIEGVHYEFIDDAKTTIRSIEDGGYAPSYSWAFGNVFLTHVYEGQPTDVWEQTAELNATAEVSPLMGFSYSMANVEAEAANIVNVVQSYKGIMTGTLDVDATQKEMVEKMNVADMEAVIADAQAQIDTFLGK